MKYPPAEHIRITALLNAFESYIEGNRFFDVFSSIKHGYLYVRYEAGTAEVSEIIASADDLFELLLEDLSSDVIDLFLCGEHTTMALYPEEITEIRNRLTPYLSRLPVELRQHFVDKTEDFFLLCNDA